MKKSILLLIPIFIVLMTTLAYSYSSRMVEKLFAEGLKKGDYSEVILYLKKDTESHPEDGYNWGLLGKAYYKNGQYEEAIAACQKSLSAPHGTYWAGVDREYLEAAYKKLGRLDLAVSSSREAIDSTLEGRSKSAGNIYLESSYNSDLKSNLIKLSTSYFKNGQYDEAIKAVKETIALTPDDPSVFVLLARCCLANNQYDEAIESAKRAIELKSDSATAHTIFGAALGMKKQYDEAIKTLKTAIVIDSEMLEAYDWMGRFFIEQGSYNEAVEIYSKGIDASPFFPPLFPSLAKIYYTMGRFDDAIAAIDRAMELQTLPGGVGVYVGHKESYPIVYVVESEGLVKNPDIQVGDKIIRIGGKSTAGWSMKKVTQEILGSADAQVALMIERGTDSTAERHISREAVISKSAGLSFAIRSLIHRSKGNQDKSFLDAEKAFSLDQANEWAQFSLGAAYLDQGRYEESIKLLSQVKDSPRARVLEATANAKLGKMEEAESIYLFIPEEELSLKNIPLMSDRMVLLQTFKPYVKEHRAKEKSFEAQGRYQEALSELSEALKLADEAEAQAIQESIFSMLRRSPSLAGVLPEEARRNVLRGEMLVKEGSFEKAAAEFKQAIRIAPYAARLYYNSALVYAELKQYPEAIRQMKTYLQAAPDAPDARAAMDQVYKWEFMMEKKN